MQLRNGAERVRKDEGRDRESRNEGVRIDAILILWEINKTLSRPSRRSIDNSKRVSSRRRPLATALAGPSDQSEGSLAS